MDTARWITLASRLLRLYMVAESDDAVDYKEALAGMARYIVLVYYKVHTRW